MPKQITRKLNWLEKNLPEGLLVDASWLAKHDFSTALRRQYVTSGWLERPARSVYRRPRGELSWQQAVISLQTILLGDPFIVGGRTALELQGFGHYVSQKRQVVHLYGPAKPPVWLQNLPLKVRFVYHNSHKLFANDPVTFGITSMKWNTPKNAGASNDPLQQGLTYQSWGQWDWPLTLSTPERAILETLDELPEHESFHQVDMLMEGLSRLSPRRLSKLLRDCRNVKVKRLFFFFADRHRHAWLKQLNKKDFDLGAGNRMLVKGGKLDPTYKITIPESLNGRG
jgi:hypothetical protein